jgi:glycolate oxidase iron-sulfur subunit
MAARFLIEQEDLLAELRERVGGCVNCGFCESVCPTLPASDFRPIIGARGRVDVAKYLLEQVDQQGMSDIGISEAFYSCLDCYACVQVCPAGVNAGKVSEIGRRIVASKGTTASNQERPVARMIVEATKKFGNPLGVRRQCASWAEGLRFDEDSDTLLYTGNMYQLMAYNVSLTHLMSSLGERTSNFIAKLASNHTSIMHMTRFFVDKQLENQMSTYLRSIYTLLKSNDVQFNYLRENEPYPGTLIYDFGYLADFVEYGTRVVDLFKETGIKKIIVIDPHTYDLLKNKYPKYFHGFDFEVAYYLDCLKEEQFELMEDEVTLHEPCYFALREDTYGELSRLLEKVVRVEYPARSGKRAMCCGGPDEALFGDLSQRISEHRFSQLEATGRKRIITACPICYANLSRYGRVEDISGVLASHSKKQ